MWFIEFKFLIVFQKRAYKLYNKLTPVLIHYIGDEKSFPLACHGNRKKLTVNTQPHIRTFPSIVETLKGTLPNQKASNVYKSFNSQIGKNPEIWSFVKIWNMYNF